MSIFQLIPAVSGVPDVTDANARYPFGFQILRKYGPNGSQIFVDDEFFILPVGDAGALLTAVLEREEAIKKLFGNSILFGIEYPHHTAVMTERRR